MLVGNDEAEDRRLVAYRPSIQAAECQAAVNHLWMPCGPRPRAAGAVDGDVNGPVAIGGG